MKNAFLIALMLGLALWSAGPVCAQDKTAKGDVDALRFAMPESLASDILDAKLNLVTARSFGQFASALNTIVNSDGTLKPGGAVSFSLATFGYLPTFKYFALLPLGKNATKAQIKKRKKNLFSALAQHWARNLSFSLSSAPLVKSVADFFREKDPMFPTENPGVSLGFGVKLVLYDSSDPLLRNSYDTCSKDYGKKSDTRDAKCRSLASKNPECSKKVGAGKTKCIREKAQECMNKELIFKDCMQKKTKAENERGSWVSNAVSLGVAGSLHFPAPENFGPLFGDIGVWLLGSLAPSKNIQLDVMFHWRMDTVLQHNKISGAMRFRAGAARVRFLAQASLQAREEFKLNQGKKVLKDGKPVAEFRGKLPFQVGAELMLTDNIWLTSSFGATVDLYDSKVSEIFVLGNLKFALAEKPSWDVSK